MLMTKCSGLPLDVKALADDGSFEGYGAVFGNVDSYGEMVMPGAFSASLVDGGRKGRPVACCGSTTATARSGLGSTSPRTRRACTSRASCWSTRCPRPRKPTRLLKAGAVDGLSIGYRVDRSAPHPDKNGVLALKKLDLMEVSIVTFPANERARVDSVKHLLAAGEVPTVRQFEELLREAGFSKSLAAAIATKAAPHLRGDPASEASQTS
jgi:hypothetical protein